MLRSGASGMKWIVVFLALAWAVGSATVPVAAQAGPGEPTISIQPAGLSLAPGKAGTLRVWLDSGGNPVHGVSLELRFDTELLQVLEVEPGSLLGEEAAQGKGSPRIDNRGGKVRFEAETHGRGSGGHVPDVVCEITVRMTDAKNADLASVQVHKATLLDAEGRKAADIQVRHDGVVEQQRFAGSFTVRDRWTGLPRHMVGLRAVPRLLADGSIRLTSDKAEAVYLDFLGEHADLFGIDTSSLRLDDVRRVEDHWLVVFRQVLDKLPVRHVTVVLVADRDGAVIAFHGNYVPDLDLSTRPDIDPAEAAAAAKDTYLDGAVDAFSRRDGELVIHVDRTGAALEPHLAWRFLLAEERPNPELDTVFLVDAHDKEVLHSYPQFAPAVLGGVVAGEVLAENPDGPPVELLRLPHLGATSDRVDVTTDAAGGFAIQGRISGDYVVDTRLTGPFVEVRDSRGREVAMQTRCRTDAACGIAWPYRDEVNVFFHANRMHDWYSSQLGHAWTNAWDGTTQLDATVIAEPTGGAWAGETLLFGAGDFARSSDVIYHECSHNVLYELYGDWIGLSANPYGEGYGLDEGLADYFAAAATGDARVGEGAGLDHNLVDVVRYPGLAGYGLDGHDGGRIIGGALWALRVHMMAQMGSDAGGRHTDRLLFEALQRMAAQPREFLFSDPHAANLLTSLYEAADDDDDPHNGVPDFRAIQRAFFDRGLLQAVLHDGDSYDVSANRIGAFVGGDLYLAHGEFLADNDGQLGVLALGDIGDLPLDSIELVHEGYRRDGVAALEGWAYLVRARDGDLERPVALRILEADADTTTVEYFVLDRYVSLDSGQSYDFSDGLIGGAPAGDLYLAGASLAADRGGQRGLVDLGDRGTAPLESAVSPPSGYRATAPLELGHTYVVRAAAGEEDHEIVAKVVAAGGGAVTLEAIRRPVGRVVLYEGDSFDFAERGRDRRVGGDLHLEDGMLRADRDGQRGVVALGGDVQGALHKLLPPEEGYTRDGVAVADGHVYVVLGREEGTFAALHVQAVHGDAVQLHYEVIRPGFVTLYDGDGYEFVAQQRDISGAGDLYLANGQIRADLDGQRGVIDLGERGEVGLDAVDVPATGYSRAGVAAVSGHTYLALARVGAGATYTAFEVQEVSGDGAVLRWQVLTPNRVTLRDRDSFDFDQGVGGTVSGGDLYWSRGKLYANQRGQRGVVDLGDLGDTPPGDVEIPDTHFDRNGVVATEGHTYVALAGEAGAHVVFRIEALDDEALTLGFSYRAP